MNKIFLFVCAIALVFNTGAQTIPNAGMESWRSNSTGSTHAFTINAPFYWYGFDSLLIADAELFSTIIHSGTNFHPQLFPESAIVHSGSSSAKVMTVRQDTLGLVPGSLANAKVSVNVLAVIGGGSLATATSFNGGSPVTLRINTVSAWVQYLPGIDSVTGLMGGKDTGRLTVQALGHIHGSKDTVVGTGGLQILPTSGSFVQITANMNYWDTTYVIDTIRIIFASSGGGASRALDSSTLYVDDISMTGVPNPDYSLVKNISTADPITVYPNPATCKLFFNSTGIQSMKAVLYSLNGQAIAEKPFGSDAADVSGLPTGLYFYNVSDASGEVVQRGKVMINN